MIALALLIPSVALAQAPQCGPIAAIEAAIAKEYPNERLIARALAAGGSMMRVYTTESGDTFTIVMMRPNGYSCVVTFGENFELMEPEPVGENS